MNLKLFLLLFAVATVSGQGPKKKVTVNVNEYNGCVPMLERPPYPAAVPSRTIRLEGEDLTATRHHIIPFNVLSTFYNTVLRENPAQTTYGDYLSRRIQQIYNFFGINPEAGAFPPGRAPASTWHGPQTLDIEVDNRMMAAFAWMPGNIFYGPPPSRRRDDPDEAFEDNAQDIVGATTHAILRRLYDNMRNYNTDSNFRTRRNVDTIFEDLYVIAQRSLPYDFNPNNWYVASMNRKGQKLFAIHGTEVYEVPATTPRIRDELKRSLSQPSLETLNMFLSSVSDSNEEPQPHEILNAAFLVCQRVKDAIPSITFDSILNPNNVLFGSGILQLESNNLRP